MAVAIGLVLTALAALLLWLGSRGWRSLVASAGQLAQARPEIQEIPLPVRPPRADSLVYLFGHQFVRPPRAGRTAGRLAAIAPLTAQELEAREWTAKMLFALFAEQREAGALDFRIIERSPTMMPPSPHKNWELEACRLEPLLSSPLGDCLSVAFEMAEKRSHAADNDGASEGGWAPLDILIEKMLQIVRAETTFWEREGVYGDLRNYVVDSLIAEGYLIEKGGDTWIDHFRRRRIEPNREVIAPVEPAAEALLKRIQTVRQRYGSSLFAQEDEPDVTYTHQNVPASLTTLEDPARSLLWADALGITLYEVLVSLRQLEPAGEGGA